MGIGKIKRCALSTVSNILALILLLFGFFAIVFLLAKQAEVKLDTEECGDLLIDEEFAFANWLKFRKYDNELNTCYCLQEFKTNGGKIAAEKTFADGSFPCKQWLDDYNEA